MKEFDDYNELNNINEDLNKEESIDYSKEVINLESDNLKQTEEYINDFEITKEELESISLEKDMSKEDIEQKTSQPNQINFVTIEKKKKKHNLFKSKVAVITASAVLCSTSIGLGLGVGLNASRNYIASSDLDSFKFEQPSSQISNISYTGTSNSVSEIIKQVKDSVVNISVKVKQTTFFNQEFENSGSGSGIIYDQDDTKVYIVTNNHVVDGATDVSVSITGQEQVKASLVGKDAQSDLAVISVLKSDLAASGINEVIVAKFADSDKMEVGEYVLAIGNALGEGKTVTQGIISAQNKQITVDGKTLTVLQTDAAINPGNSGGALVNSNGEVVGINTSKFSGYAIEGMGYAIPSSVVKTVVTDLMQNGTSEKPYFGIMGFTITQDFMDNYNINTNGVFVTKIEAGSSADSAGLKSTDIIVGFNASPITNIEDLSQAIGKCKINDKVTIDIIRNGSEKMTLSTTLNDLTQSF